jgi:hypothetical protein
MVNALAALQTFFTNGEESILVFLHCAIRTALVAVATSDAPVFPEGELDMFFSPLGIMAPWTAEGATFHEDCRADPGTIMHAVAHDIENDPFLDARLCIQYGSRRGKRIKHGLRK